jgi:hypothetical protein
MSQLQLQAPYGESVEETKLRTAQISVWVEEAEAGNCDLGISAFVSTLMDPADSFNA